MAGPSRDVLLAAVIGAQGLKGEVKVKTFTESPEACILRTAAASR